MNVLIALAVLLIWQHVWFVAALRFKRNDLADVAWGLGFILVAWVALITGPQPATARSYLVAALVTCWGLRLAYHIGSRVLRTNEDSRYQEFRKQWGSHATLYTYLQVFLLQAVLLCLVALPLFIVPGLPFDGFHIMDGIGVALWGFGFFFEAVADAQLAAFVAKKRPGQIMQTGLWRYTRHPNYFGEVTLWWGLFMIVASTPSAWWSVIGPLTITFLIIKVSGIPMLEKKYANNPEFEIYKKRTSLFFPTPPRGGSL
jgi:steroid 5-alpha reductase family enzyme